MPKYYYHAWTASEEKQLVEIMTSGLAERKKMRELFQAAAVQLNRSPYSCQNRWYVIRNKYESKAV